MYMRIGEVVLFQRVCRCLFTFCWRTKCQLSSIRLTTIATGLFENGNVLDVSIFTVLDLLRDNWDVV